MNKDSLSTLVNNAINTILTGLVKIIDDRVAPAVEDGEDLKVVLKRVVTELQSEFKPTVSTTPASSVKVESKGTGVAKPKSTAKDVLKDSNNNPIICEGVKKTDNSRCTFGAKFTHEGKHYCGTHHKVAQGTKADNKKKPSFSGGAKAGEKSNSSVTEVLNELDAEELLDL
jgi:hypothetical protein